MTHKFRLDYETGYFWAEKALAVAIENHNNGNKGNKIKPFTKGNTIATYILLYIL